MAVYNYSASGDFSNEVSITCLVGQINDSSITSTTLDYIQRDGDDVDIYFVGTLSGADEIILDGVIGAHDPDECPADPTDPDEGGVDVPQVQIRRSTNYTLTSSWADIVFDTTDIENQPTILKHDDTNTERIYVYEDGVYIITFSTSINADAGESQLNLRILKNGTTVVPGSERIISEDDEINDAGNICIATLEDDDYITFQVYSSDGGTNVLIPESTYNVIKMKGPQGQRGDDGEDGAPGAGSSITFEDEGTPVANTPHSILNVVGNSVSITDQGSGRVKLDFSEGNVDYFDGYYQGTTAVGTSWTDVPINAERQKTSAFSHTSPSAEVTINTSGSYVIIYKVSTLGGGRSQSECRLVVDTGTGYVEVPGSVGQMYNRQANHGASSATPLVIDLNDGDKIKMQGIKTQGTANTVNFDEDCNLIIYNVAGKGEKGDTGPAGSGTNIVVQEEGTNVTNTPHTILDFRGTSVTASDQGSGVARITVGASLFGSEFQQASSDTESSTTSTTFQQKLRLTTASLPSGTYRIGFYLECWQNNAADSVEWQVELNDTTVIATAIQEPDDTSATDRFSYGGFDYQSLSGVNTIDIDWRQQNGNTAYIRRARLEIWRVS